MRNASLRIAAMVLVAAVAVCLAQTASAQQYYYPAYQPPPPYQPMPPPRHYYAVRGYFGGGAFGTAILNQAGGPEPLSHGGGFTLFGGLRFGQLFGLEFAWMASFHNPVSTYYYDWWGYYNNVSYLVLQGVTADLQIHIPTHSNFDPFVQGGGGVYFLGREGAAVDSLGGGFQAGGGFNIWAGPAFGFGIRLLYRGIYLGPPRNFPTSNASVFVSALTAEANLQLRF